MRQQPETARGVVFVTLENETGSVNVIVCKRLRETQRPVLLGARLLAAHGPWQWQRQREGEERHLVARQMVDATPLLGRLGRLAVVNRDFR